MTEQERAAFEAIVTAETDSYQRTYLDGLLRGNTATLAPLSERCALPAVRHLWVKR